MDYYRLLKVSRNATNAEIKRAYRKLALQLHPDTTGNDKSKAEHFKEVSVAYSVLSDSYQRSQYDASLSNEYGEKSYTRPSSQYNPKYHTEQNAYYDQNQGRKARGRMHGINEEVWYAHHYGHSATNFNGSPKTVYGMHIAEEMFARDMHNIDRKIHKGEFGRDAGFFMRREAKMKKEAREFAERNRTKGNQSDEECVIS